MSETFTNDAVKGSGTFSDSGSSVSAGPAEATVTYNAGTDSYSVSGGGVSQIFSSSDKDAGLSVGDGDVYVRTSGNTSDSLFLTRNATDPGTKSSPQYRYVGGGVWQRTIVSSSQTDGTINAFAYGVATPDASLPRSGSALFDVSLYGVGAFSDGAVPARGSGTLTANLGTGAITGNGTIHAITPIGPEGNRQWSTVATLSSTNNSFAGAFGMGVPFGGIDNMNGTIRGRFYGPNGEEVGAAWWWKDAFLGTTFAGVMLGKNDALFPANTGGLTSLSVDEDLADAGLIYETRIDTTTGQNFNDGEPNPHPDRNPDVKYSETAHSYTLNFQGTDQPILASDRDAASSTSAYDVYRFTRNGNETYLVRILKPGASNPEIALTYTSYAYWNYQKPDYGNYAFHTDGFVAFGQATPASGIPTTGTGSYSGRIYGISDNAKAGDGSFRSYDVSGTAALTFDFGAGSLTGSMHPLLTDPKTSTGYDLGIYPFINTEYATGSQTFRGSFNPAVAPAFGLSNFFNGMFTGPAAEELFARWQTATTDPLTSQTLDIFGVLVGKKN